MPRPAQEIITYERPICDKIPLEGNRCLKTAVVSIDGVYRCELHRNDEYSIQFAAFAKPITWVR